ncbi:MAG: D-alanyl-D-alanine carboxypeptidase family protein [Pelagibacteraceae bacterium]
MKKFFTFFLLIFYSSVGFAENLETSAKQAYLIDVLSGKVLFEKNKEQKISPASITKIMTTIVAFDLIKRGELSLSEKFTVSKKAWKMSSDGYSSMFVMPNDKVSVENLLRGIIVVSGNDACVVLAEGISGTESEFVFLMNNMAKKIGLENTKFANSSGLYDGDNYSTVEDIAKMSSYMIFEYPELYKMYAEKKFTWDRTGGAPITQGNRNPLLYKNIGSDGLKTGHLENSGYSLAGTIKRGDRRLISVISGTSSKNERSSESVKLLSYGSNRFDLIKIAKNSDKFKVKTWNIKPQSLNAELEKDFYITIPTRRLNKLKIEMESEGPLTKIVKKGDVVSKINIYFDNELIGSKNLIASSDTKKENFFIRFVNSISYFIWG